MKLENSQGLAFDFLDNGSVRHIEADPIRISLKPATSFSEPGTNIYLRKRSNPLEFIALLGPASVSRYQMTSDALIARGNWAGLEYICALQLSEKSLSWQWKVDVTNATGNPVELDLVYLQDVGLKSISGGLVNEYYVSQYIERLVLEDEKYGAVICCRQNMKEPVGHPWLMIASGNSAASGSVDGMQFYGKTYRETGTPEGLLAAALGGTLAGESPAIALQEQPFILESGGHRQAVFVGTYQPDHGEATSPDDLKRLPRLFMEFNTLSHARDETPLILPEKNLFNTAPLLAVEDLSNEELDHFFGTDRRHREESEGHLLSFFCGHGNHVMLRAKEVLADRPHAHIMQANAGFVPDESIMSTTAFAFGVFNSHLSQGNTNFSVLLSVCTSQFNSSRESGQRIFIEMEGRYFLLGVPSVFEIGLNFCRWIYMQGKHCFQVRTWTSPSSPRVSMDFRVLSGPEVRLLVSHDFDTLNGWSLTPGSDRGEYAAVPKAESMLAGKFPKARFRIKVDSVNSVYKVCGDEMLYSDEAPRNSSYFILDVSPTSHFCMSFIGEVRKEITALPILNPDEQWLSDYSAAMAFWNNLSLNLALGGGHDDTRAIGEILPWYGMNAITHFLTPYGLEQFSGAAWGTRDVSQGPIDLLLTMEKYEEARQVLRIIFSNQNPDGGWPQWWMFDSFREIRAQDSHGDVCYWVIIALSNYIRVTGDLEILGDVVPYFNGNGSLNPDKTPVSEHVGRLIRMIISTFIPGTALVPFGGGDWNDSLQPVSRELAERMISSWTVEMNYQAFRQYQAVYEIAGEAKKAGELKEICKRIRADFNKYLVKEGVVAGYGLVEANGEISVMLHPSDTRTGVRYSLLPMERGILSGIFTKEQAEFHQGLIELHLKGPDGARLMDRPLRYRGGIQTIFQRAESSTFFGREIGLMYVHEHIRYAESLAKTGKADAFVKALRQAIPVGYRDIVPCGDIRQSNCYYSSSDVAFKTRYEADDLYGQIQTGRITLRGGWRVYSSGPGIYLSLIVTRLLGLRIEFGNVIIDPVIPIKMDGLTATMNFLGHRLTLKYSVRENCFSPKSILINGKTIPFTLEDNTYRTGGAVIPMNAFKARLEDRDNTVDVEM